MMACGWVYTVLCAIFLLQQNRARTHVLWTRVMRIIHSFEPCESRKIGNFNIPICFTRQLCHSDDQIQTALPPLRLWPNCPPGLNLGKYDIWDGHGFRLLHEIWAVQLGNYDVILLMETKILDYVYCRNRIKHDVVCSKVTPTAAGGERGRGGGHWLRGRVQRDGTLSTWNYTDQTWSTVKSS